MKISDPNRRIAARADLQRLLIGLSLLAAAALVSLYSSDDAGEPPGERGAAAQSLAGN